MCVGGMAPDGIAGAVGRVAMQLSTGDTDKSPENSFADFQPLVDDDDGSALLNPAPMLQSQVNYLLGSCIMEEQEQFFAGAGRVLCSDLP